jgi:hypothetical protein
MGRLRRSLVNRPTEILQGPQGFYQSPDLVPDKEFDAESMNHSRGFSFQINALQTQAEPVSSLPGRPPIIDQPTPDPESG